MNLENILSNQYAVLALFIWEITWKGIGCWKAARKNDKFWYIALLVINSLGILPMLYIFIFSKLVKGKLPVGKDNPKNK